MNIGLNQGRAGGAGLPEHLHAHVLPRWSGDTNFMATVAGARVVPDSLESVAAAFRRVLPDALASVEANPDRS
jgi:ATP adenylyltransferase